MGILDRLKRAFIPAPLQTMDDAQFGRLVFCAPDLWQNDAGHENDVLFDPTHDKVTITVTGDREGPSPTARHTYEELKRRYAELIPSIASFLREYYWNAKSPEGSASDTEVMRSFSISSISIELTADNSEPRIDLTYRPSWREELHVDVTIRGWRAVNTAAFD
jgi:hypothetical protein